MREKKKPLEWNEVAILKGERAVRSRLPAVRLTYSLAGKRVLFSHTPGILDGVENFMPTMHLRDDFMPQYLPLLERSARLAATIRMRYDEQSGRERLTSSIAEAIRVKG
jgi:hypothetical protein